MILFLGKNLFNDSFLFSKIMHLAVVLLKSNLSIKVFLLKFGCFPYFL